LLIKGRFEFYHSNRANIRYLVSTTEWNLKQKEFLSDLFGSWNEEDGCEGMRFHFRLLRGIADLNLAYPSTSFPAGFQSYSSIDLLDLPSINPFCFSPKKMENGFWKQILMIMKQCS
jgi:hypothetical protein